MRKTRHKHRKYKGMLKGKTKGKKILIVSTSVVPIVLSVAWLVVLGIKPRGVVALSPARSTPLVVGLVIFIIGYIAFLSMMFSEDIKEWFDHLRHKAH